MRRERERAGKREKEKDTQLFTFLLHLIKYNVCRLANVIDDNDKNIRRQREKQVEHEGKKKGQLKREEFKKKR